MNRLLMRVVLVMAVLIGHGTVSLAVAGAEKGKGTPHATRSGSYVRTARPSNHSTLPHLHAVAVPPGKPKSLAQVKSVAVKEARLNLYDHRKVNANPRPLVTDKQPKWENGLRPVPPTPSEGGRTGLLAPIQNPLAHCRTGPVWLKCG
jgi:hypothetical protein